MKQTGRSSGLRSARRVIRAELADAIRLASTNPRRHSSDSPTRTKPSEILTVSASPVAGMTNPCQSSVDQRKEDRRHACKTHSIEDFGQVPRITRMMAPSVIAVLTRGAELRSPPRRETPLQCLKRHGAHSRQCISL